MTESYDKSAAVVVLPAAGGGRVRDPALRDWLSQSDLATVGEPFVPLLAVLGVIGRPAPTNGLAALRIWGQTGDRPTAWIAAADPIYLEPSLDQLYVNAFNDSDVAPSDLRALIDHLQHTLAGDTDFGFVRMGSRGYVTASRPFATADRPAYQVHQRSPQDFLPTGEGSDHYRNLVSEIEMALHEHDINIARQSAGHSPINSLWIWGGGYAPDVQTESLPPLFSDDPLLVGFWESKTALAERWPGDILGCLSVAVEGFVATLPEIENRPDMLEETLRELRELLLSRRVSALTLLFRDGICAHVKRSHKFRVWRRNHAYFE